MPLAAVVSLVDGCGSSSAPPADVPADAMVEATASAADAQTAEAAAPDAAKGEGCPRMTAAADRARKAQRRFAAVERPSAHDVAVMTV